MFIKIVSEVEYVFYKAAPARLTIGLPSGDHIFLAHKFDQLSMHLTFKTIKQQL